MKRARLIGGLAVLIVLAVLGYLWWGGPDPRAVFTAQVPAETAGPEAGTAKTPEAVPGAEDAPDSATPRPDGDQVARTPPQDSVRPSVTTGKAAPQTGGPAAVLPSFDVVRVEPSGEAVVAGRATPGSTVRLLDGGRRLAEITTNRDGEWVIVLRDPLAPGTHELSLESELTTGEILLSENVVVVSVPAPPMVAAIPTPPAAAPIGSDEAGPDAEGGTPAAVRPSESLRPLAVLMPREGGGPSRIIQAPEPVPGGLGDAVLLLETVDYDGEGRAVIGGRGRAGVVLILYLDGRAVGRTVIGPDGRWRVALEGQVPYGVHTLRVDQLDDSGRVVARVESPFSRGEIMTAMADETAVIVQPGNSLWRIARRVYGKGVRYAVIYEANRNQIRDPDLIYPGQIFVVPPN